MQELQKNIKDIEIPIFFSTDNNYLPFLEVSIRSLIKNASRDYRYRIIVLNSGLDKTKTGFDIPDGSPWTVEEFYPPRFIFEIKQGKTFEEGTLFKLPVKVDGPGEIVFSNIECADDTSSFKINSIRVKVDWVNNNSLYFMYKLFFAIYLLF